MQLINTSKVGSYSMHSMKQEIIFPTLDNIWILRHTWN
jgi:hypothetical protein